MLKFPPQGRSERSRANPASQQSAKRGRRDPAISGVGALIPKRPRVPRISAQGFIAALTRENDGDMPPRKLRHEVQRDARRPDDRLIFMPNQFRQSIKKGRLVTKIS